MAGMALEHALLVSLSERPGSGLELNRRFAGSIGFFWSATHQQIYRTLARMEADGWVAVETVAQDGRPDKKVYSVSAAGRAELHDWLGTPIPMDTLRSDLGVKMRGASYGDRAVVLSHVREVRDAHAALLATYEELITDFGDPPTSTGESLDRYHVLRGGVLLQQTLVRWLDDYLEANR